jgi:hypothetical protein
MLSTANITVYYKNHRKHANKYTLWAKQGVSLELKQAANAVFLPVTHRDMSPRKKISELPK